MVSKLRTTPAMVVAVIALVAALGGTSYAAVSLAKNSVGTKQIRKGAVKRADLGRNAVNSKKVKNGSLLAADFAAGQLQSGSQGPAGPAGPTGLAGAKGEQGPIGPSNAYLAAKDAHDVGIPAASHTVVTKDLPKGFYTFTASAGIKNDSGSPGVFTCSILASIGDLEETLGSVDVTLADDQHAPVAITGATYTDGTTAELRCESIEGGDFADVTMARLVALHVGDLD